MYKINKITIPKSFKSKDGKYKIILKDKIKGMSEIIDNKRKFISSYPIFELEIENIDKEDIILELKEKIIEIYEHGITDLESLTPGELCVFYYIKNIINYNNFNKEDSVLIIGYKSNYIDIMKNTITKFNIKCNNFEIEKNIELYMNKNFDQLYISFLKIANDYNKFVIDLTNLYLPTNYEKTKKIINYIESNNGDILFLIDHIDTSYDKFIKIFGDKYKDCVLDKMEFIYPNKSFALYKIKNILFKDGAME